MKRSNGRELKKQKGRKKLANTRGAKVMISRDYFVGEQTKDPSGSACDEESPGGLSAKEEELCCEEHICLITSSAEIPSESLLKLEERVTSGSSGPIFVDLTTDERGSWKQTIFKRLEEENERRNSSVSLVLEPRIMIADSSSKSSSNAASLATALRGPCFIPVQPNRSLPIRPAPRVPARSLRKDPPKSAGDVVEVEARKTSDGQELADYLVPRISSVGSLKRNIGQESKKRKYSRENQFLHDFCDSETNEGTSSSCRLVSSSKEQGNKVVPPLRLKKVVRTEVEGYGCRSDAGSEDESNYRIVTGTTPRPPSTPPWNDVLYDKRPNVSPSNSDSHKLEYRRNKLKQKLRELHGKAVELAKQMASDAGSQRSTRLRQVMNRYEKQIENLSKLHSKLSATLPAASEVIDVNDDPSADPSDDEYFLVGFSEKPVKNVSPASSPEPPKLSPLNNYENSLPEEDRNSPPILARVDSTGSSPEEEVQISDRKLWATEDAKNASSYFEERVRTAEDERSCGSPKKKEEKSRLMEDFSQSTSELRETEKIKCLSFSEPGTMIDSVTSDAQTDVQENNMLELKYEGQVSAQSDSFEIASEDVSFPKISESTHNVSKSAWNQFNSRPVLNQEQQKCKGEETASGESRSMTEQFPSLGNWLSRMSKKQASKSKSRLQASFASTENSARISGPDKQKMSAPNTANESVHSPQYSTERWQYHHQQQQRQQQLLQHVAASVTLSQPAAAIPPLRSPLCPSLPMAQFYPNNYAIDPYNSATLSYHSAICPYGTYPYHSRYSGYFPMQESLRPLQHADKRFPSVQDSLVRCPPPSTSLQHPNVDFDCVRGSNNATATCLPSFLSSSHQTLPRTPLTGYPANGQFSRNRMIPDVVAAAAAAAVVAAASIDRQRDTLTYNRNDTDTDAARSSKNNRTMNGNFSEDSRENTAKYQQMQNFLLDRLTLVKTADNFAQTNSLIDNDSQASSIVSTPYQAPLNSSHQQLSKSLPGNDPRKCDTPHLGKVSRSPNSLHDLACSNCGSIGPKFKCLGCEMAFYCDERCQEKHWYVHVQRCPKRMPKLKKVAM